MGRHDEERRDRAVRELVTSGFTVLEAMIDEPRLKALRAAFDELLDAAVAAGDERLLSKTGTNRYNMWIPLREPFLEPELVANPLVLSVLEPLLGEDLACTYYASDTAYPGSGFQPVHPDVRPLFPGLGMTLPPVNFVLDLPLVDFTPDNGPLEVWTGASHLVPDVGVIPRESPSADPEALATPDQLFTKSLASTTPLLEAGDILLRDARLWHRGTPNRSAARRPMLALVYSRPWYGADLLPIERELYDALPERTRVLFRRARPRRG